jgi:GDPmannose 4,6-dehydratase
LRREHFLSKKIALRAIRCKKDPAYRLSPGDLKSEVDWGYAPDYVDAMRRILNLQEADDFNIATGEKHPVEDFFRIAFEMVGLDWHDYVMEKTGIISRPAVALVEDPAKLERMTGSQLSVTFPKMVRLLGESAGGNNGR